MNISGDIFLKLQSSLDRPRIELDLAAGALAINLVIGVAEVSDDAVLSVLSGLDSSGTWKGSWAAFIAWWLCRRSSRLDSNYQKASIRTSLCPKTGHSTLKLLSCFRVFNASCDFYLTLLLGFQDTGTLGTSVFSILDINHWTRPGCMPAVGEFH